MNTRYLFPVKSALMAKLVEIDMKLVYDSYANFVWHSNEKQKPTTLGIGLGLFDRKKNWFGRTTAKPATNLSVAVSSEHLFACCVLCAACCLWFDAKVDVK